MDDYLKIKLDKMTEEGKIKTLKYLATGQADKLIDRKRHYDFSLAVDFTEEALEAYKSWGKMVGISTGYPSLDRLMLGLVGGEVTVIAAKTSVGKSALALNIASNVAVRGKPVLFVTLEMTRRQMTTRLLHLHGGDTDNYYSAATNIAYQKTDRLEWRDINGLMKAFCQLFTPSLVVIDHLHYFVRESDHQSEVLGAVTKELHIAAEKYNVPVILVSHVRKTDKDITMEDLRGSSFIGQDADIVLLGGRTQEGDLSILIQKNRNRGFDPNDNEIVLNFDQTKITEKAEGRTTPWSH
jgi:replicative DNA helicase